MSKPSYHERLERWRTSRFIPPPEVDLTPRKPTKTERVAMRDDVHLYTEIFIPHGEGPFPVILHRSPYPMYCPPVMTSGPLVAIWMQVMLTYSKTPGANTFRRASLECG